MAKPESRREMDTLNLAKRGLKAALSAAGLRRGTRFRGDLRAKGNTIHGWLLDTQEPLRRVSFELLIDGEEHGTFRADASRSGLIGRPEFGDEFHGFTIALNPAWITGAEQTVVLRPPDADGFELRLAQAFDADGAASVRGSIVFAQGRVRGWIANLSAPDHRLSFKLLIDGVDRGLFVADKPWPSLVGRSQFGDGSHGFEISIPTAWLRRDGSLIEALPVDDVSVRLSCTTSSEGGEQTAAVASRNQRIQAALDTVGRLNDNDLAELLSTIDKQLLPDRIEKLQAARNWNAIVAYADRYVAPELVSTGLTIGRAALATKNPIFARHVLNTVSAMAPDSGEAAFFAGLANSRSGKFEDAIAKMKTAVVHGTNRDQAEIEILINLARLRRRVDGELRLDLDREFETVMEQILSSSDTLRDPLLLSLADALSEAELHEEALLIVERLLTRAPANTRAMLLKGKFLTAVGRMREAVAAFQEISDIEPSNTVAEYYLKILSGLVDQNVADASQNRPLLDAATGSLIEQVHKSEADWIAPAEATADQIEEMQSAITQAPPTERGAMRMTLSDGSTRTVWRRALLQDLLATTAWDGEPSSLNAMEAFYAGNDDADAPGGRVLILTPTEAAIDSGTLMEIGAAYEKQGLTVRRATASPTDSGPALPTADAIRDFAIANQIDTVHTVLGSGTNVASALRYSRAQIVFGIHVPDGASFAPDDRDTAELETMLAKSDTIYTDSRAVHRYIEDRFGVLCEFVGGSPQ